MQTLNRPFSRVMSSRSPGAKHNKWTWKFITFLKFINICHQTKISEDTSTFQWMSSGLLRIEFYTMNGLGIFHVKHWLWSHLHFALLYDMLYDTPLQLKKIFLTHEGRRTKQGKSPGHTSELVISGWKPFLVKSKRCVSTTHFYRIKAGSDYHFPPPPNPPLLPR